MRRDTGVAFSLIALLFPAAGDQADTVTTPEGFLYRAAVPVPGPGWVRVRLDGETLAIGREKRDWRVFDPDGVMVPSAVLAPVAGAVPARTLSVEKRPGGWSILFDLGPTPVRHRSIRIEPEERVSAPRCRLESSPDRKTWTRLADADLFSLGEGGGLRRSEIDYPESEDRYLRLEWPASAGFPELKKVEVESAPEPPGGPAAVAAILQEIGEATGSREYVLELPASGLPVGTLSLEIETEGSAGYRLFSNPDRRWEAIEEGEAESGPLALDLEGEALPSEFLRLVLYAPEETPARLVSASAALPPAWILFEARRAGDHTLALGFWEDPPPIEDPPDPAGAIGPVASVERRGLTGVPPPALPSRLTDPRPVSEAAPGAGASWTVLPGEAVAGGWARLDLPDEIYDATAGKISGLRLTSAGRWIPFVRWIPPAPARLFQATGLVPRRRGVSEAGRVEADLTSASLFLTQIEVLSSDGPFIRPVWAGFRSELRPGVESGPESRFGALRWECGEPKRLPCLQGVTVSPRDPARRLEVEIGKVDEAPEIRIDLLGWRARHVLLFRWPEGMEVRLAAGFEEEEDPFPDLDTLRARILAMPWSEARLEGVGAGGRAEEGRGGAYLLPVLLLAGAALIVVLVRCGLGRKADR